MSLSDRVSGIAHGFLRNRVMRMFNKKIEQCEKIHPELFTPVKKNVKDSYDALWRQFGLRVNEKYLYFYSNISGIVDYRYLPEDIFIGKIERILNDCNRSGGEGEDKNQYSIFIDRQHQPRFVLRFIRGCFFDEDYNFLSDNEAKSILGRDNGDLIGKVAAEMIGGSSTLGGHGIKGFFYKKGVGYIDKNGLELNVEWIRKNFVSYVLQERVEQCEFSAQFNAASANTCRIITFRCPWDGKTLVVKAGMRFGVSDEVFDNLSSGGVGVAMGANGELGKTAYNWYHLEKFTHHPSSGVEFGGKVHPYFKEMSEVACQYAARIPNFSLLSWDFIADKNGAVKILELNETRQGTDWQQYDFGPFFGALTDKVVDWCVEHQRYDYFRHIRTWY